MFFLRNYSAKEVYAQNNLVLLWFMNEHMIHEHMNTLHVPRVPHVS
jgi:hypothetical protein